MLDNNLVLGKEMDDGSLVSIPCCTSQRILVCGKTGTGKSYTLGVLIEELSRLNNDIVLVVDPQGIFWSMAEQNPSFTETDKLWEYSRDARGFNVNVLVPGDPVERYGGADIVDEMRKRGINIQGLRLNPSDLTPEMWCDLFDLDINGLMGIMLFKAVRQCGQRHGREFLIDDIAAEVIKMHGLDQTKEAIQRKLDMAHDWQIFEEHRYREIWEILQPEAINILDLSVIAQGRYGLRNLVLAVLATFIFRMRTIARRREALGLASDMRKVWLAIDEAHNFCPSGRSTLSKEILIRWAKEGRQPGLSLLVASQQPAAIDAEILTQCGIRIVHRITSRDDYRAIDALSQDYISDGLPSRIKQLSGPGQTLVIDDERESVVPVQVRPRQSLHGGGSA
ncbi:MAG: ATP-binding protein [Armatimonadetes bacterium]|nr:ATP-binding protein [Armatimonadota bacterium]